MAHAAAHDTNADGNNHVRKGAAVILSLSSVPLIMVLGNSMLIPILPQMKADLDITQFQVSLIITLFSVSAGIIIPLSGILSDRFGRKKVIIPSLLLYGAGGILAGTMIVLVEDSYYWVIAGRILQGLGAAGTAPIAMALVSDIYTGRDRSKSLGIIETSNAMGKVVSPILGSIIALITWYSVFFAFPVFTLLSALAVWLVVREPTAKKEKIPTAKYVRDLKKTWKRQGVWLAVAFLAGAVTLFVLFGVLFYLSDILEKTYKIEGVKKGLVLAIPLLGLSAASYWTGWFLQKRKTVMKAFIVSGLATVAFVSAAVPLINNNVVLLILLVLGGLGSGLVLPCLNTMITSAVGQEERGIITSLYGSVRFLGVAAGPPVFGALMENENLLFWSVAALAAVTSLLAFFFIRRPSHQAKGGNGRSRIILRPHPALHKARI